MAPKVISSYPPDRWIRTLNQRYPNLWMELKKSYDDPNLPLSSAGKAFTLHCSRLVRYADNVSLYLPLHKKRRGLLFDAYG